MDDGMKSISIIKYLRKFGGLEAEYADWRYNTLRTIGLHKPDIANILSGTWSKPKREYDFDDHGGRDRDNDSVLSGAAAGGAEPSTTAGEDNENIENDENDETNGNEAAAVGAAAAVQELQTKLKDAEDTVEIALADLDSAKETLSKKQSLNTSTGSEGHQDAFITNVLLLTEKIKDIGGNVTTTKITDIVLQDLPKEYDLIRFNNAKDSVKADSSMGNVAGNVTADDNHKNGVRYITPACTAAKSAGLSSSRHHSNSNLHHLRSQRSVALRLPSRARDPSTFSEATTPTKLWPAMPELAALILPSEAMRSVDANQWKKAMDKEMISISEHDVADLVTIERPAVGYCEAPGHLGGAATIRKTDCRPAKEGGELGASVMNPKVLLWCFLGVLSCPQRHSSAAATENRVLQGITSLDEQKREDGFTSEDLNATDIASTQRLPFLTPTGGCSADWTSWPSLHAQGAKGNTFLVFRMFAAIGNLFISLGQLMRVARFLEVGVVLDSARFPGMRVAFDPSEIMWDVDSEPIIQRAKDLEEERGAGGMHPMVFSDGALILSDDQFLRLKSALQTNGSTLLELMSLVHEEPVRSMRTLLSVLDSKLPTAIAPRVEPCAWDMLLSRSPALLERLAELSPWKSASEDSLRYHPPDAYVAWHMRTVDPADRIQGYNASVHKYMITEPSTLVCPAYENATTAFQASCSSLFPGDVDIFIAANSKDLARDCIDEMAVDGFHGVQIDLGGDTHTRNQDDPSTALSAFIDFVFLMDATVIVRTGSSFSGMVATIRGMSCSRLQDTVLTPRGFSICLPRGVSCVK
eukprot:g9593.t1